MVNIDKVKASDIDDILNLLSPYVKKGIVLERTREDIISEMGSFFIARDNDIAVGVVSYHDYDNNLFEIRSLVVAEKYAGSGIGRALVNHVVSLLRKREPQSRIFALTYVPGFFSKLNFELIDKNYFPEKIWKDCVNCPRVDCCNEIALINRG